jgi:hypothetical protein
LADLRTRGELFSTLFETVVWPDACNGRFNLENVWNLGNGALREVKAVGMLPYEINERLIFGEDYRGLLSRKSKITGSGLTEESAFKSVTQLQCSRKPPCLQRLNHMRKSISTAWFRFSWVFAGVAGSEPLERFIGKRETAQAVGRPSLR